MIGYVMVGTNDYPRAVKFYDELMATIGATRAMEFPDSTVWANGTNGAMLAVCKPFDGKPATVGNGTMVAIMVDARDKVNALHGKALELGGKDEGPVGARSDNFYAGYFRDLDGNKLSVFTMS
jgi:predicted lactoylglutathione lyase